ncbi:MAG: LptF/LptG family permease [Myxococcales bacterium]
MSILDRYLAKEVLLPFLAGLAFLFMLLFAMQLLRGVEVMFGSGVRAVDLLLMMVYLAPHFLSMAMPVSFLLAVLLAVGRWSEDRESLAVFACGISPWRLWVAPVMVALAVASVGLLLGRTLEPRGLAALKLHVNELIKRNMAGDVKPGIFYSALADMTLYAQNVDPKTRAFTNVLIADERDPNASILLLARHGEVEPAGGGNVLQMKLRDGEIHRSAASTSDYALVTFEDATLNVDVARSILRSNRFGKPREDLTVGELETAAREATQRGRERDARSLWYAHARRTAAPVATVVFALCGVPLALGRRRGSRAVGAVATLLAYIAYYVIARGGEIMAETGRLAPGPAAWMPNVVFLLLGVAIMWRTMRSEAA